MGQGPGAIACLTGRKATTGVSAARNIIQLFDNNDRLGMIVYSFNPEGRYGVTFASG
jgi:hypothetical protein